jgi:hypothetical protein
MKWWLAPASGLTASPALPGGVETRPVYNENFVILHSVDKALAEQGDPE